MKFLYKIYSAYDGFFPARIPRRLVDGNKLRLGWDRYLDAVEMGDEVWVYFHGPHRFEHGVYVRGFVCEIDFENRAVLIRLREHSTERPLTDRPTSRRVAEAVATRFRQVFLLPEEWATPPNCDINSSATTCEQRSCEACPAWKALPRISSDAHGRPTRLISRCHSFAPAYWVLPRRSFYCGRIGPLTSRTTELFSRFKTGQRQLAFPLALGMYHALKARGLVDFDCIIPIPLSPDKAAAGEIHRTLLLSRELGRLLGTPVEEWLTLTEPISKRRLMSWENLTVAEFERRYFDRLRVSDRVTDLGRILLVDDVATKGSTLSCAVRRILEKNSTAELSSVTAAQMILRDVVLKPKELLA